MAHAGDRGHWFALAAGLLGVASACGGKAQNGMPATGGSVTSAPIGGASGVDDTASHSQSGGTRAQVSTAAPNGGTTGLMQTGGAIATGGTAISRTPTGGHASTGGTKATGGNPTGGNATSAGGKNTSGGANIVGGTHATGGHASGGAATAAGGKNATGGTDTNSGTSATGGVGNTGGTSSLSEFCSGTEAKVSYLAQTLKAPATSFESEMLLECCFTHGVNLHTKPALDFDVAIDIVTPAGSDLTPGTYDFGTDQRPLRMAVRKSTDEVLTGDSAIGTATVLTTPGYMDPWALGFCLEVTNSASAFFGMRVYVPQVAIAGYDEHGRWQMFLLSDDKITPAQAATQPLDALTLAQSPLLDLSDIAYVDNSTNEVGVNRVRCDGNALKQSLHLSVQGLPFVVVADGVRVYLGSFITGISSIGPTGPWIVQENITADSFVIQPDVRSAYDVRFDEPIRKVLTETGKLIP